jgi:hypothetical protein
MRKKRKKFDRAVPTHLAVVIISLVLLVCSILVWKVSEKNQSYYSTNSYGFSDNGAGMAAKKDSSSTSEGSTCKPHYYEGKAVVKAWAKQGGGDGMVVQIDPGYISNLPIDVSKYSDQNSPLEVKLIDPTATVKRELVGASQKIPAKITIQGYAQICQGDPVVSLQPATLAFKKTGSSS